MHFNKMIRVYTIDITLIRSWNVLKSRSIIRKLKQYCQQQQHHHQHHISMLLYCFIAFPAIIWCFITRTIQTASYSNLLLYNVHCTYIYVCNIFNISGQYQLIVDWCFDCWSISMPYNIWNYMMLMLMLMMIMNQPFFNRLLTFMHCSYFPLKNLLYMRMYTQTHQSNNKNKKRTIKPATNR